MSSARAPMSQFRWEMLVVALMSKVIVGQCKVGWAGVHGQYRER